MNFEDLGLSSELLKAVQEAGYSEPTPIQEGAIPHALMGRDLLGTAQTGTGKTAAFLLPALDILMTSKAKARMPRVMILEPTRELALQVEDALQTYAKYHPKINSVVLMGGVSYGDQDQRLLRGVDIIIATPGRLIDTFERGRLMLSGIKYLVIDEADRMMDMGFMPDVERIVSMLPPLRQSLFFSATMPKEIRRIADGLLSNPREIAVDPPSSAAETVTQGLTVIHDMDKREGLRRLIRAENVRNALIFCNRKKEVAVLYRSMNKHGFNVAQLHGDMDQSQRTETMEAFRDGKVEILVCSDVAARGLDIQGLSHVFNFDVPMNAEDYIHRIGRTGRAGLPGRAFTLAVPEDQKYVEAIEALIGKAIPRVEIDGLDAAELDDSARAKRGRRPARSSTRSKSQPKSEAKSQPKSEANSKPKSEAKPRAAIKPDRPSDDAGEKKRRPSRRRSDKESTGDKPVVGWGDHAPAFMRVPTDERRSSKTTDAAKETVDG